MKIASEAATIEHFIALSSCAKSQDPVPWKFRDPATSRRMTGQDDGKGIWLYSPVMTQPTHMHRIPLPDGRTLAVAEYGDPAGKPLLFLHGTPGSHRLAGIIAQKAGEYGFRLLAPDRPGLGLSSPHPTRTFLGFAEDIRAVLDHLGLAKVDLVGISGGGPYALACAHAIQERLGRVVLLSPWWFPYGSPDARVGLDPLFKLYESATRRARPLTKPMAYLVAALARKHPRAVIKNILRHAPPDDRKLLADAAIQDILAEDIRMAFAQGWRGQWRETMLDFSAPGFDVAKITLPITLHHGAKDNIVPLHFVEKLAAHLPNAVLHVEPEGGHFVAVRLQDAVFQALLK